MRETKQADPQSNRHIFISYRRNDTNGESGRLIDTLKDYFDAEQLFFDIETINPGSNFTETIPKFISSSGVILFVIGKNWTGRQQDGSSRIQQPDDWVRIEVEKSLQLGIPVIPVLVDNASLPAAAELPETVHPLLNLQAQEISDKRWHYDTEKLAACLVNEMHIEPKEDVVWKFSGSSGRRRRKPALWMYIVFIALATGLLAYLFVDWSPKLTEEQQKKFNTHIQLAKWCEKKGRIQDALAFLDSALVIKKNDKEVIASIERLRQQIKPR